MAKIKKCKRNYTIGDVLVVENVPTTDKEQTDDDWGTEILLTSLHVYQKARTELKAANYDLFKTAITALTGGRNSIRLALGENTGLTENESFEYYNLLSVPDHLWPLLDSKVMEYLANVPKNVQPRHVTVGLLPSAG